MNKTRTPRSPTKLGTRTRPVTRSKSPRVPDSEEPAGNKPPDSPKKSMSPRKSARPKPEWSSSTRPVTKDSQRSKSRPQTKDSTRSNSIANKRAQGDDNGDSDKPSKILKPNRELTPKEMEEEAILCATFEKNIAKLKKQLTDKTVIFDKLSQEIFRMLGLFERLERMGESRGNELMEAEQAIASHGLTHGQRKELMEKGPFNLVFHGIKADWIEEEMADDEEFKRDVLEQKIRTLIREECELMRDVGIVDVYRHMEGAPLRGAFPVVVQFKARREKEQIMWRCKEKLRDSEIVVTEDSQSRLMALMNAEAEKIKKEESLKRTASLSPKKRRGGSQSPTKVPTSPVKKSNVINPFKDFSYSSEKPAHLSKNGGGFGGVPGSPTKSAKKFSNGSSNGGGRSLILNNKKGNESKQKQKLAKSLFFSEGEEEESEEDDDDDDAEETDVFPGDEEFEDHFDDLLDDFPAVPKSPEKAAIKLPESPQKALFEDFMF